MPSNSFWNTLIHKKWHSGSVKVVSLCFSGWFISIKSCWLSWNQIYQAGSVSPIL